MNMKYFAAGAALCALGMTGCRKDIDDAGTQIKQQAIMTMRAIVNGPQTRAVYKENTTNETKMDFSWQNGDEISMVVNGVEANKNIKLTTTDAAKSATFSGAATPWGGEKKPAYAFYPYDATPYIVTGGDNPTTATVELSLPNPQAYTVGGAVSNSLLVGGGTATAEGGNISATVAMKQVMSIIKLNISNVPAGSKVARVKLMCDEAVFPTTATVNLSDATITNPDTKVKELTMNVTDNTTEATKTVSFAMFPTDLTGKKIRVEVTYDDNMKWRITEKDGTDFVRNMHYVMEFDGRPTVWAGGNLIADGSNGAKIGSSTDGGLYFQFGSLIGWAGGATGDGKDTPPTSMDPTVKVKPSGYTGSTAWNQDWRGDPATENVTTGTGDPCKYYLKGTWRLPTKDEYMRLFKFGDNNRPSYYIAPWSWSNTPASATHTSGLAFPASGYRTYDVGHLRIVGSYGFYWSASPDGRNYGRGVQFYNRSMIPIYTYSREFGLPVRCVQ